MNDLKNFTAKFRKMSDLELIKNSEASRFTDVESKAIGSILANRFPNDTLFEELCKNVLGGKS